MMRVEVFVGAVLIVVVVGCASTRKEEVMSRPAPARSAAPAPAPTLVRDARLHLELDPSLRADAMGHDLARQARAHGVEPPVAFVWGDVSAPSGAERAELESAGVRISGFLVGSAQNVDMGKLAPDIHDVVMIGADKRGLVSSHPSAPGRDAFDLDAARTAESDRQSHESFAFVSVEPGDVADDARAGDLVALLGRLPSRVRYAVMGLPD